MGKVNILFLCTGNSCRSQMAEGWARALKGDNVAAWSAGTDPQGVNRLAVQVMKEAGVDISSGRSKNVSELSDVQFDYVITLCGDANENCPMFPGSSQVVHFGFPDPPKLAAAAKTDKEALPFYRDVRDQIKEFVLKLPDILKTVG